MRYALHLLALPLVLALVAAPAQARSNGSAAFSIYTGHGFYHGGKSGHAHQAFTGYAHHPHGRSAGAWLGYPFLLWPDWTQTQIVPSPPAQPQVIIIGSAPPSTQTPAVAPDYSYVPGCHAIPNGYHCDTSAAAH